MRTVVDPRSTQAGRNERTTLALVASVLLHVLLLMVIPGGGAPGIPGGSQRITRTEVFTLGYLGEWDERHDGRPTADLGASSLLADDQGRKPDKTDVPAKEATNAVKDKVPEPRRTQVAQGKTAVAPSEKPAAEQKVSRALTSPGGEFSLPLADEKAPPVEKTPQTPTGATERGTGDEPAPPAGKGNPGVVTGRGTGPVQPPAGASLLQVGSVPAYPKNAANEGVEGAVMLRIHAASDGRITRVEVAGGTEDRRLRDVASRTVAKSWRVKPFSQDYVLNVSVEFRGGSKVEIDYGEVELVTPAST